MEKYTISKDTGLTGGETHIISNLYNYVFSDIQRFLKFIYFLAVSDFN